MCVFSQKYLPRGRRIVIKRDYLLNRCENWNSKTTLWSQTSFCLLGHLFDAEFSSICPGEFFKLFKKPDIPKKDASKKIFKLNFSACGASKIFVNKLPNILLTHHFDILAKKNFLDMFQNFEKFLLSKIFFQNQFFEKWFLV